MHLKPSLFGKFLCKPVSQIIGPEEWPQRIAHIFRVLGKLVATSSVNYGRSQASSSFDFTELHILHPPADSILSLSSLAFVTFGPTVRV